MLQFQDWDGTALQTDYFAAGTDLSDLSAPENPSRENYVFVGWDQEIPDIMPDYDVIITALYSINQYKLEYVDYD